MRLDCSFDFNGAFVFPLSLASPAGRGFFDGHRVGVQKNRNGEFRFLGNKFGDYLLSHNL